MTDSELHNKTEVSFEEEWTAWLEENSSWQEKSKGFLEAFKLICKSWYLRGAKIGVICGAALISDSNE